MTTIELIEYLRQHDFVWELLNTAGSFNMANWYVGAGAICQTVWNIKHRFEPGKFIKDVDLVYFDSSDLSAASEEAARARVRQRFGNEPLPIDVTNQARVHQWYAEEFGFEIQPYRSAEEAIDSWPTTASAIGVRLDMHGRFEVYAPFGLHDIDNLIVQPNKKLVTQSIYESKSQKWKQRWPELTIVPW